MAALSLPAYHVTGPVHHYVRTPTSTDIFYLGTAETTPRVELRPAYRDIMNDIAGRTLPAQRTKDGESAVVGTVLTRYSKAAYGRLCAVGSQIPNLTLAPGWEGRKSRGALVFGQLTWELWLVFQNYWDDFATPGLEPGYYFPQVMYAAHTRDTLGTEGEKLLNVFDCQPYWEPQASANAVQGTERSFMCYRTDEDAFPPAVQVPQ